MFLIIQLLIQLYNLVKNQYDMIHEIKIRIIKKFPSTIKIPQHLIVA